MTIPEVQQYLFAISISKEGQLGIHLDQDGADEFFSSLPESERPSTLAEQTIHLLIPIVADLIATRNIEQGITHADGLAEELYQAAAVFANCLLRSGEITPGTEAFDSLSKVVNGAARLKDLS